MKILFFSVYWIVSYLILDQFLERIKLKLDLSKNQVIYNFSKKSMKFKEKLPSVSRFDKTKIKSTKKEYLIDYNQELSKAFYMHSLIFLFLIPLFFIVSPIEFFINILILLIVNLPFLMIIYYNKIRIQVLVGKDK